MARSCTKWTILEDTELETNIDLGISVEEIAHKHGRTVREINARKLFHGYQNISVQDKFHEPDFIDSQIKRYSLNPDEFKQYVKQRRQVQLQRDSDSWYNWFWQNLSSMMNSPPFEFHI